MFTPSPIRAKVHYLELFFIPTSRYWVVMSDGARLAPPSKNVPPPCRRFAAQEFGLFPARQVKVQVFIGMICRAIRPIVILSEVGWVVMPIHQRNLLRRALDDTVCFERKRSSRRWCRRHLIRNLCQHKNESKDCNQNGDSLHEAGTASLIMPFQPKRSATRAVVW